MRDFDMGFKLTYSYSQIQKKKKRKKKKDIRYVELLFNRSKLP